MANKRKQHTPEFKAKWPLGGAQGPQDEPQELASKYGAHRTQVAQWKRARPGTRAGQFYEQIGRFNREFAWVQIKQDQPSSARR